MQINRLSPHGWTEYEQNLPRQLSQQVNFRKITERFLITLQAVTAQQQSTKLAPMTLNAEITEGSRNVHMALERASIDRP